MQRLANTQPLQDGCRVPAGPALYELALDQVAVRKPGQAARRPAQCHAIVVDTQVVDRDMETGKCGTVKRDAELDAFRASNEVRDDTSVIDVARGKQLIREVD